MSEQPWRTSAEVAELFGALAKAQAEIENIEKGGVNPAFRAKYAKLGAVLDEIRPKFAKHGISITQMPINGEGSNIGVVTRFAHSSGQWIESCLFVAPTKFDAQGAGSAITYCRRYSLMAMAGLAPDDDDDGNAAVGRPEPRADARRAAPMPRQAELPKDASATIAATLPPNPEEPPEVREARDLARVDFDRLRREFSEALTVEAIEHEKRGIWARNTESIARIQKHGGAEAIAKLHYYSSQRLDQLRDMFTAAAQ